LSLNKFTVLNF